jgi:hypothetical protein
MQAAAVNGRATGSSAEMKLRTLPRIRCMSYTARAIPQTICGRLLTVEARFRAHGSPFTIFGGQSGKEQIFLRVFRISLVSTIPSLLHIHSYITCGPVSGAEVTHRRARLPRASVTITTGTVPRILVQLQIQPLPLPTRLLLFVRVLYTSVIKVFSTVRLNVRQTYFILNTVARLSRQESCALHWHKHMIHNHSQLWLCSMGGWGSVRCWWKEKTKKTCVPTQNTIPVQNSNILQTVSPSEDGCIFGCCAV